MNKEDQLKDDLEVDNSEVIKNNEDDSTENYSNQYCKIKKKIVLSDINLVHKDDEYEWTVNNTAKESIKEILGKSDTPESFVEQLDEKYKIYNDLARNIREIENHANLRTIAIWIKIWSIVTIVLFVIWLIILLT